MTNQPPVTTGRRELIPASPEHKATFPATFQLKEHLRDDPMAKIAFEHATNYQLWPDELTAIGAMIERKVPIGLPFEAVDVNGRKAGWQKALQIIKREELVKLVPDNYVREQLHEYAAEGKCGSVMFSTVQFVPWLHALIQKLADTRSCHAVDVNNPDDPAYPVTEKKITINGRRQTVQADRLSYDQIVQLAATGRTGLHSVTYHGAGSPNSEGILAPGEWVQIKDGTHLSAMVTDNA